MIQRYDIDHRDCDGDDGLGCATSVIRNEFGNYVLYNDHASGLAHVRLREITDAQVEAAARMLYVQLSGRKWADAPDHAQRLVQESYRIIARAALEAARAAGGAP